MKLIVTLLPAFACLSAAFGAGRPAPQPWTDDQQAAKSVGAAPAQWMFPAARPLRVLEARGRWYPYYAIDRALARLGGAALTESWHQPSTLRFYPESYEELMSQHLVIVGNINGDAFGPVKRGMLKHFVEAGGAVLFLGGRLAFGNSYRGTALEAIAPVTFAAKDDVTAAPPGGLLMAPGPDSLGQGFAQLAWSQEPRVFWYHDGLTLKPGSKVLLTAAGKPLLIAGAYGKGRVALFAGTVLGDPQAGQNPFWTWNDWPAIMATTIGWLTAPLCDADASLSAEGLAALKAQLLGLTVKRAAKIGPLLTRAAVACRDRETARLLLDAVANLEGDVPLELVSGIGDAARPYVDGTFGPQAETLLAGPQSNKVSLGLCVLGQTRAAGARQKLERAMMISPVDGLRPRIESGGIDTVVEDPKDAQYVVRLGAIEGLDNLGDPAALPALQASIGEHARTRSDPAQWPHEVTQADELYQESVLSALRCGDASQAGPAVDLLLEDRYVLIRMMGILDAPQYQGPEHAADRRYRAHVLLELPRVRARLQRLYHKLNAMPEAVLPALAARLAEEDDPRAVSIAFAIFGRGAVSPAAPFPPAARDALRKAILPAIADMAGFLK